MSDGVDTTPDAARPATSHVIAVFALLALFTAGELWVIGLAAGRAARITALSGLLIAKVGLVLSFFMQARARRPAARLAVAAIALAAGAAVVLMLETVFRVNVH